MDHVLRHSDIPYRSSSIRAFDRQTDRDGDRGKPPLPINAHPLRQLLLGMKDWAFSKTAQAGQRLGERRMTRKMSFNDYIFLGEPLAYLGLSHAVSQALSTGW